MLTLTYTPNAYRQADNLIPIGGNVGDTGYESRPGFFQVVADNINRAIGWNDACLMEIFGGVYVWHGGIFEQINDQKNSPVDSDLRFSGSRFQGLLSLGNREERIYIGNGKTLFYIHRNVIGGANVESVELIPDTLELTPDTTGTLSAVIKPSWAINKDIKWQNDQPDIASVDEEGLVTAHKFGSTTISVVTEDGSFTDTSIITVVPYVPVTGVAIEDDENQQINSISQVSIYSRSLPKEEVERFYEAIAFDNEFLDDKDKPYALPKCRFLATWRNRLWAGDGSHIIYHCLNDNPHHWEPLDAIPIQGGQESAVTGLCALGNQLIVSTMSSLWQVVGDSPYNWEFQTIVHGHGAMNERSMTTDGLRLFYLDRWGVYELGRTTPISKPIEKLFSTPDYGGELLLEARGEYLYLLLNGRLMVYHTVSEQWSEIIQPFESNYGIKGLVIIGGQIGFYGDNGLWISGSRYSPDCWLNKTRKPVISTMRTWPVQPNKTGDTFLNRMFMELEGVYGSEVNYRVYPNSQSEPLSENVFNAWHFLPPSLEVQQEPLKVLFSEQPQLVNREVSLQVFASQFEHEIQASGYIRLHSFNPRYQFTERDPTLVSKKA